MAHDRKDDQFGFDQNRNVLAESIGKFVPQWLARRALSLQLETDRTRYRQGDPVTFRVTIHNRLPLPVTVATETRRLWGWAIDGQLEASDETRYQSDTPGTFTFRANERKVVERTWNGRVKHVGERTTWEVPSRGTHELTAFVGVDTASARDAVEFEIE